MKLADNLRRYNAEPMPVAENTIQFFNCFRLSIQMNVLNCAARHHARKNSIPELQFTDIRKHKKPVTPHLSLSFKQSDFREINANAILMFFMSRQGTRDVRLHHWQHPESTDQNETTLVKVRDRLLQPI